MIKDADKKSLPGGGFYYEATHPNYYWAVGYDENKLVKLITPRDKPRNGGEIIRSPLSGFISDNYDEFISEIRKRNLKFNEP